MAPLRRGFCFLRSNTLKYALTVGDHPWDHETMWEKPDAYSIDKEPPDEALGFAQLTLRDACRLIGNSVPDATIHTIH